jgi:hypothetical protein
MRIEQAVYGCQDAGGYRFLARSPGFAEAWLPAAERLCTGFGERPAGVACPLAVFAQPLDAKHVAVIQVADQGRDDANRPGAMAFRLLVVARTLYADLGGDPFRIAEAFPPAWAARGELPALEWMSGPMPRRTVEEVRRILDVEAARLALVVAGAGPVAYADLPADRTALLLGGAQALVDGGRLVFRRDAPDPALARQLWALLPTATRAELWPTTFAFGNKHAFHLAIVPDAAADDFKGYVKEAEAGDYPEGRYESSLQHAAESGDQAELDGLLARPSHRQRFKLLLGLLAVFALVPILINLPIGLGPQQADEQEEKRPVEATPLAALRLPKESALAAESPRRRELRDGINAQARTLGVPQAVGLTDAEMVEILGRIDAKLGETPERRVADLSALGDPRSVIRAILWKHAVAEYAEPALNDAELLERLAKIAPKGDR